VPVDPGELPPGHHGPPPQQLVTKIVAGSDGIKPLAVSKDQNVLVRVEFKALNNGGPYLSNGGALEHAQETAAHESPRTTKLYDRTREHLTQDEVERIRL
jgi:hypothetical protein